MRCLLRNKTAFYYALYMRKEPTYDGDGNENGTRLVYRTPVRALANISPATGTSQVEQFGNLSAYDRVIVLDDTSCPIDENTVLFVEREPSYNEDGSPLFDYVVTKIARSLNSVSIAIRKVSVS